MTTISLPHRKDDELQTISISDGSVDFQLHFNKSDESYLRNLIRYLLDFYKTPMKYYIGMDYVKIGGDIMYGFGYQENERQIQIGFNGCDIWLNLTRIQLITIIRKLKKCYTNLLKIK